MKLNLTANNTPQERIKQYLEQNASATLADKINNGVPVEKDGKQLIGKKTLHGFMKYATDEARKVAEKGASCACIDDATVFGWAIHYFEEDSITETLYNPDGTEYKAVKKAEPKVHKIAPKTTQTATTPPKSDANPSPKKSSPKKPQVEELEQYTLFAF